MTMDITGKPNVMKRIMVAVFRDTRPVILMSLLLVFILAAYLRIDFLNSVEHNLSHDSKGYDVMVRQWIEDGVYAYKDTEPNAKVTPGYPAFMAIVYKMVDYTKHDPFYMIRLIQVFLSMFTLYLIYRLARRLGGAGVGLGAAAIGAVYPSFIWSNGAVLTEVLCTFFLTLYIYVQMISLEKKKVSFALLSGALLGLTVLVRSEFLPILLVSHGVGYLWQRNFMKILKLLLISVVGTAIILSPWVIRNMITLNKVIIASTQVNPFAAGTYPYKNYADRMVETKGKTQMEVAKERIRVGFTEHTLKYVTWYTVGKLAYIYGKMFSGSGHTPFYTVIPILPQNILHWGLIGLFPLSFVRGIRLWKSPGFLLVTIVVAMSTLRLLFVPETRYNFTVMPMIIILDCVTVAAMIQWYSERRMNKNINLGGSGATG